MSADPRDSTVSWAVTIARRLRRLTASRNTLPHRNWFRVLVNNFYWKLWYELPFSQSVVYSVGQLVIWLTNVKELWKTPWVPTEVKTFVYYGISNGYGNKIHNAPNKIFTSKIHISISGLPAKLMYHLHIIYFIELRPNMTLRPTTRSYEA